MCTCMHVHMHAWPATRPGLVPSVLTMTGQQRMFFGYGAHMHACMHACNEAHAMYTQANRRVRYPANFTDSQGKTYIKQEYELNRTISVFQIAFKDFTLANRYNQMHFQSYGAPKRLSSIEIFGEKQLYGTKYGRPVSHALRCAALPRIDLQRTATHCPSMCCAVLPCPAPHCTALYANVCVVEAMYDVKLLRGMQIIPDTAKEVV